VGRQLGERNVLPDSRGPNTTGLDWNEILAPTGRILTAKSVMGRVMQFYRECSS